MKLRMRYGFLCLLSMCCLLLSGCSLFGPVKQPEVKVYTLSLDGKGTGSNRQGGPVVLVSLPVASPGYDSNAMVYMKHPYQLNVFSYHRWVAPPAEMLLPLIVQSVQNSGCFGAVVSAPFTGETQMVLDAKLLVLQQEFVGDESCVRMAMEFNLVDNTTHRVIAHRRFETVVQTTANTPYAGVEAANTATKIILQKLTRFLCAQRSSNE